MDENNIAQKVIKKYNVKLDNIYNSERKLQFISEYYENKSQLTVRNVLYIFNTIGNYEKQIDTDICLFLEHNFKELFTNLKLGYATFISFKSPIKNYIKWCAKVNLCEKTQFKIIENINKEVLLKRNNIKKYYFHDLNELYYFLEYIINQTEIRKAETELNLETIRVTLFLAWFGIELKDAVKIKKIDVDAEKGQIYIISKNKYVKIDSVKALNKIIEYRDSSGYNNVEFENTDLLLRSRTKRKNFITALRNLISRYFGENMKSQNISDKIASYENVYWSGIYYRAIGTVSKESVMDTEYMENIFKENYSKKTGYHLLYVRYRMFLSYCQHMYPEFYKYLTTK